MGAMYFNNVTALFLSRGLAGCLSCGLHLTPAAADQRKQAIFAACLFTFLCNCGIIEQIGQLRQIKKESRTGDGTRTAAQCGVYQFNYIMLRGRCQ
jgi:hypothetical protein